MDNAHSPLVHRGLTTRKLKTGVFTLELLNAVSTTYFFYDIYFYTRDQFHFNELQNLILAAVIGVAYAVSAFFGGRFAQRFGYLTAVRWGAGLMAVLFLVGSFVDNLWGTMAIIFFGNIALCLTWPALEALMGEGEPPVRLQSLVGIYNVIWAGGGAIAYFTGGILLEAWAKSIFIVPAIILFAEVILATWLQREADSQPPAAMDTALLRAVPETETSPIPPALFLKMALLANPLAYLAINTVIPTIPSLASHLGFSKMVAGFVCSIWLFVRAGSFMFLRLWTKWHYRFRFLAASYLAMVASFGAMLLTRDLWLLILAQAVFGMAIGLIYYS
jgi:MFS family permease